MSNTVQHPLGERLSTSPPERIGQYRLLRCIGRGGMSEVYEAVRDDIGLHVALKLLDPELAKNQDARQRFLREARLLSRVDDPGLVKIVDFGADSDTLPFLAMELLKGDSLRDRLDRAAEGRLPLLEAVRLAEQVTSALISVHRHGVIHRDLKPDNLMLVRDLAVRPSQERIKLMDFGIARAYDLARGLADQDSVVIGTPTYMSPEQFRGEPVGPHTDVYALGIVLYEILVGSPPFVGALDELRTMHLNDAPPRLRQQLPGAPEPLEQLVRAMLEKRPERRPSLVSVQRSLQQVESLMLAPSGEAVALTLHAVPDSEARLQGVVMEPRGALASGRSFYGERSSLPPSSAPTTRWQSVSLLAAGMSIAALVLGSRSGREPQPPSLREAQAASLREPQAPSLAEPQAPSLPEPQPAAHPCCVNTVLVRGGRFRMGSTREGVTAAYEQCRLQLRNCRPEQFEAEQPQRWVELSSFHVDQDLVTTDEYVRFLNNVQNKLRVRKDSETLQPRYVDQDKAVLLDLHDKSGRIEYQDGVYRAKPGQGDLPVVQVSWNGANQYCQYRGKRLLREAEWEYLRALVPTHTLPPRLNLLPGLGEWVADRYAAHYPACAGERCKDPVVGDSKQDLEGYRVVRGCAQNEPHVFCRPQARGRKGANDPPLDIGFRCASPE